MNASRDWSQKRSHPSSSEAQRQLADKPPQMPRRTPQPQRFGTAQRRGQLAACTASLEHAYLESRKCMRLLALHDAS